MYYLALKSDVNEVISSPEQVADVLANCPIARVDGDISEVVYTPAGGWTIPRPTDYELCGITCYTMPLGASTSDINRIMALSVDNPEAAKAAVRELKKEV